MALTYDPQMPRHSRRWPGPASTRRRSATSKAAALMLQPNRLKTEARLPRGPHRSLSPCPLWLSRANAPQQSSSTSPAFPTGRASAVGSASDPLSADCRGAGAFRSERSRALPGRVVLLAKTGEAPAVP